MAERTGESEGGADGFKHCLQGANTAPALLNSQQVCVLTQACTNVLHPHPLVKEEEAHKVPPARPENLQAANSHWVRETFFSGVATGKLPVFLPKNNHSPMPP